MVWGLLFLLSGAACGQQSRQEQDLVRQVNESRAQAGLPPLKVDERLTRAAREHSQRMADRRLLGHVLPGEVAVADRLAATGLRFDHSGENVGYNSEFGDLHNAWMHSPPHRKNILDPEYTLVGIGVVRGADGIYWGTQDFARGMVERTASQAEGAAAQSVLALRKKSGGAALKRMEMTSLHDMACSMARTGKMNPRQVMNLPGVRYAITYSNSQPEDLPVSAEEAARQGSITRFAVGACEATGRGNPGGTYYVVIAFY